MTLPTKLSPAGAKFIGGFEGYVANWYLDPVGVRTIGYGHTGPLPAGFTAPLSRDEALRLMIHDSESYASAVRTIFPRIQKQTRFDALVSLAYNLGAGILSNEHTIGRAVRNRAHVPVTVTDFTIYDMAGGHVLPGLLRRRQAEWKLWQTGKYA